jgi:hypothetical protein
MCIKVCVMLFALKLLRAVVVSKSLHDYYRRSLLHKIVFEL